MNNKYVPNIFCILGPTGIGKSLISIELANLLPLEIISVDSGLIYKGMDIGTAKPSKKCLQEIPHKLIDILDPAEHYSVKKFLLDVRRELNIIFNYNGNIPLLVGGNMMYYYVLFNGLFNLPKSNFVVREYINMLFKFFGVDYLYNMLSKINMSIARKIHCNDNYRIIRFLEIYLMSNNSFFFYNKILFNLNVNFKKIIILPKNKKQLIYHVKKRFIHMLDLGLEEEVNNLYLRKDLNKNMPSIKCIGYKQMWLYLEKKITYLQMINNSITSTMLLVKKQLTWLRRWYNNSYVIYCNNYKECIRKIYLFIKENIFVK